jgi:hypothetical protein
MWHGGGWFAYMRTGDQKPKVTRELLLRVLAYARPYRWEITGMLAAILLTPYKIAIIDLPKLPLIHINAQSFPFIMQQLLICL